MMLPVNAHDDLKGWHGSPTKTESEVPMLFSVPGVPENGDILARIQAAVSEVLIVHPTFRGEAAVV